MQVYRKLFLSHLAQTSRAPLLLEIESAEGIFLYAPDGKRYMDMISGVAVSNVGHRHPDVVAAIKRQVDRHLHVMVYGEFVQSPQVELAEALIKTTAPSLNSVYLVNSGSEAIEGGMKLAKRYTGRSLFVACRDAYHGSSGGALSLCGNAHYTRNYRPLLPGIKHIRFGCVDDLNAITDETAAFVVETIQGEAGIKIGTSDYWTAVRRRCDETGALLILDEIQCGFGRTGRLWAHEHYETPPDVLVCAKGMGGGMPIGGFVASQKMMHVFTENPALGHITTFGGHPVSAAAALAALNLVENLLEGVQKKEALFHQYLQHDAIKDIRSEGLLMAVEFESHGVLRQVIDKAIRLGVITDWFLFNDRAMRIAPPLTITEKEIEMGCDMLLRAMHEV